MIADGILPGNEGRGYVLRRLLRRAIMKAQLIGIEGHFLNEYVDEIVRLMGDVYPEIVENRELERGLIMAEEDRFGATLRQGQAYLEEALGKLEGDVLSGRGGLHPARHLRLPRGSDPGDRGGPRRERGHGGLRGRHGGPARARPRRRREGRRGGLVHLRRHLQRSFERARPHGVHRLRRHRRRDARAGRRRRWRARGHAGAGADRRGGAGRHALLRRDGRRSGGHRRHRERRRRRPLRAGHEGSREGPVRARGARRGDRACRGRYRRGPRGREPPRRHRAQPHRHPHPARRAAPACSATT